MPINAANGGWFSASGFIVKFMAALLAVAALVASVAALIAERGQADTPAAGAAEAQAIRNRPGIWDTTIAVVARRACKASASSNRWDRASLPRRRSPRR